MKMHMLKTVLALFALLLCAEIGSRLVAAGCCMSTQEIAKNTSPDNTLTSEQRADGWRLLFDGKTLDGWSFRFRGGVTGNDNTFTVKDGQLHCSGDPFGYIYTDKNTYSHYTLEADLAFVIPENQTPGPKYRGNSGILVHIGQKDAQGPWPQCIEVQGLYQDTGRVAWRGFDTKDWTYARSSDGSDLRHDVEVNVLYDRKTDPGQLNNLLTNPEYACIQNNMEAMTQEWMKRFKDQGYNMEDFQQVAVQAGLLSHKHNYEYRPVDLVSRMETESPKEDMRVTRPLAESSFDSGERDCSMNGTNEKHR